MGILKKVIAIIIILSFTLGCASAPDKISASYVSPLQYTGYSCNQIKMELLRVNRKIMEVSGVQKSTANKDAVAMAVGMIIFWPALFFLIGGDKKEELARLKGEYEALETVAIQKECDMAEELKEARKQRETNEKERKEKMEKTEKQPITR